MALQPVDDTTTDAETYKGNDIDSDGDGVVDSADSAADADALQGNGPSAFANSGHSHTGESLDPDSLAAATRLTVPVYSGKSNVPAQPEGSMVYISGDGLYVEDGT